MVVDEIDGPCEKQNQVWEEFNTFHHESVWVAPQLYQNNNKYSVSMTTV